MISFDQSQSGMWQVIAGYDPGPISHCDTSSLLVPLPDKTKQSWELYFGHKPSKYIEEALDGESLITLL